MPTSDDNLNKDGQFRISTPEQVSYTDVLNSKYSRLTVNANKDVFKYGLIKYEQSQYEEPTYLGFTIEIDENSALFTQVLPFLQKHSNIPDLKARIPVYNEFISKIRMMFNSQDSIKDDSDRSVFIKQHYINSVSGLNNLNKKFIKWREDKLTFELHESLDMFSTYISRLYNNLIYSYENGRLLIPENLLKFNLYIKISEIRDLTSVASLLRDEEYFRKHIDALKYNVTSVVYTLTDCEFDFFDSAPFEDTITQAGIDSANPVHSILSLDLYFKRVNRQTYNPLIAGFIPMNDDSVTLDITYNSDNSNTNVNADFEEFARYDPNKYSSIEEYELKKQENEIERNRNVNTTVINYKQKAFLTQSQKKATSLTTYDLEKNKIIEPNDFQNEKTKLDTLKEFNKELAPEDINNDFKSMNTNDLIANNNKNFLDDPSVLFERNKNKYNSRFLENTVNRYKKNALNYMNGRRKQLMRTFVIDLINKAGDDLNLPISITAGLNNQNVYTDSDYFMQFLSRVGNNIGNQTVNEIMSVANTAANGIIGGI